MGLKPVRGKINNKKRKPRIYRRIKLFCVAVCVPVFASPGVRVSDFFPVSWEDMAVSWEEPPVSSQGFDVGRVESAGQGAYD